MPKEKKVKGKVSKRKGKNGDGATDVPVVDDSKTAARFDLLQMQMQKMRTQDEPPSAHECIAWDSTL